MPQKQHTIHGRDHLPTGADPIPGLPDPSSGEGLEDILLGLGDPVGLWKLNEPSGSTAFDSSGNGNDMTVPSTYAAPTWAQTPAGPPGDQNALFVRDRTLLPRARRVNIGIGFAYTDDFSAGLWVKIPTGTTGDLVELIGQGKVFHSPFNGWGLFSQHLRRQAQPADRRHDHRHQQRHQRRRLVPVRLHP